MRKAEHDKMVRDYLEQQEEEKEPAWNDYL
jgi:hypothetical protein